MSTTQSPHGRLQSKTALITGASSGLGRAIAFAFASEGASICCVDLYEGRRNPIDPQTGKADSFHNRLPKTDGSIDDMSTIDALQAMYRSPSDQHFSSVSADMTSAGSVKDAVAQCVLKHHRLDVMVNCAGISVESKHTRVRRIHETTEHDYDITMSINAKGVFLGCKYALEHMLQQPPLPGELDRGWLINIASIQGLVGYAGTPAYCASKGAVVALTRQIALDYASDRIHCNALCPGFLKTAMTQNLQSQPEVVREIGAAHPFGGMGSPEDVARAAVFLASADAAWVTGVPLVCDGGMPSCWMLG